MTDDDLVFLKITEYTDKTNNIRWANDLQSLVVYRTLKTGMYILVCHDDKYIWPLQVNDGIVETSCSVEKDYKFYFGEK